MKLQLTEHDTTVTIETDSDDHNVREMAQMCRQLLLAQGYPPSCVSEHMPNEDDLDEIIADAINNKIDVDNNKGLTDYTP